MGDVNLIHNVRIVADDGDRLPALMNLNGLTKDVSIADANSASALHSARSQRKASNLGRGTDDNACSEPVIVPDDGRSVDDHVRSDDVAFTHLYVAEDDDGGVDPIHESSRESATRMANSL